MNPFEASTALSLLGDRRPLFSTKRPFVKLLYVACTCYRIKSVGWEFLSLFFERNIDRRLELGVEDDCKDGLKLCLFKAKIWVEVPYLQNKWVHTPLLAVNEIAIATCDQVYSRRV